MKGARGKAAKIPHIQKCKKIMQTLTIHAYYVNKISSDNFEILLRPQNQSTRQMCAFKLPLHTNGILGGCM